MLGEAGNALSKNTNSIRCILFPEGKKKLALKCKNIFIFTIKYSFDKYFFLFFFQKCKKGGKITHSGEGSTKS